MVVMPPLRNLKGRILTHTALDLFSGHGWGVAMRKLGVHEHSVDIMPEVRKTRARNGMTDIVYENAWDVHLAEQLSFDTLIASPPCQTFALEGNGKGRKALKDVISLIAARKYEDVEELQASGHDLGDDRTALVLAPMHYIHKFRPKYVALEQVPSVQPIWEAYAEVLKDWGYSVWTGVLKSEQYGVPQTRKRAILLASTEHEVTAPTPTNSSFNSRDPYTLDAGLPSWKTIGEALGKVTIEGTGHTADYLKLSKRPNQAVRRFDMPAMTMTFGNDYASARILETIEDTKEWVIGVGPELYARTEPFTVAHAGKLQSYPEGFVFEGSKFSQFKQVANSVPPAMAENILKHLWQM